MIVNAGQFNLCKWKAEIVPNAIAKVQILIKPTNDRKLRRAMIA